MFSCNLGGQMWGSEHRRSSGLLGFRVYKTHISCSPREVPKPSPPLLFFWVFIHHLILARCMWIIHHPLNQSIEFHLVLCYTGHVIDSLVAFHWSLNDTQCGSVDTNTRRSLDYTMLRRATLAKGWVGKVRGGVGATLPKRSPLRFTQGRHVQLAVPTSVQNRLKTGMREACPRGSTLDRQPW